MTGRIIKGIGGFYYISTSDGVYECRAAGIFRKEKIKPLVGDIVEVGKTDEKKKTGSIVKINHRKNRLLRPEVANIDQVCIVFAAAEPNPDLNLLDRFLVVLKKRGIPVYICFNKTDAADNKRLSWLHDIYFKAGYPVMFISAREKQGIDKLYDILRGKTTVLAGPSGVGKSTLMNLMFPEAFMETGDLSGKIQRGKHTTRHSQLFCIGEDTFLMDTPGFGTLYLEEIEVRELKDFFPEFKEYSLCRFNGCYHRDEPDCGVKDAVNHGRIAKERYGNYLKFLKEIQEMKKY